jgi:hypothetical protein
MLRRNHWIDFAVSGMGRKESDGYSSLGYGEGKSMIKYGLNKRFRGIQL